MLAATDRMKPTPRLAIAVLASFLAGGVVPQAGLVVHDHPEAGAAHVHAGPLVPHRHGAEKPHVHAGGDDSHAALELPHHVHTQHPFVHADKGVPPAPLGAELVAAAPTPASHVTIRRAVAAARSRGPPPSLAS